MDPDKKALSDEYKKVMLDPVFGPVLSIIENDMGYSGRLIHSFLYKELITDKKHELWFVFAGRPLRFSLQEFHAITGLNTEDDKTCDFSDWVDDGGFW
ncbi:hypothetical protein EUTSA_v10019486mg, partial [Eutrema salsugineum]